LAKYQWGADDQKIGGSCLGFAGNSKKLLLLGLSTFSWFMMQWLPQNFWAKLKFSMISVGDFAGIAVGVGRFLFKNFVAGSDFG
jgi:hypothetical protein